MDPCGMVMDFLRSHHLTPAEFGTATGLRGTARWYPCAPGALAFPEEHAFCSPVWEEHPEDFDDSPGCYPYTEWRGKRFPAPAGRHFHGQAEWFLDGIPPEVVANPGPRPTVLCGRAYPVVAVGSVSSGTASLIPIRAIHAEVASRSGGDWTMITPCCLTIVRITEAPSDGYAAAGYAQLIHPVTGLFTDDDEVLCDYQGSSLRPRVGDYYGGADSEQEDEDTGARIINLLFAANAPGAPGLANQELATSSDGTSVLWRKVSVAAVATFPVVPSDHLTTFLVDCSTGPAVAVLPPIADAKVSAEYWFVKVDGSAVNHLTLTATGGDRISTTGASTLVICAPGETVGVKAVAAGLWAVITRTTPYQSDRIAPGVNVEFVDLYPGVGRQYVMVNSYLDGGGFKISQLGGGYGIFLDPVEEYPADSGYYSASISGQDADRELAGFVNLVDQIMGRGTKQFENISLDGGNLANGPSYITYSPGEILGMVLVNFNSPVGSFHMNRNIDGVSFTVQGPGAGLGNNYYEIDRPDADNTPGPYNGGTITSHGQRFAGGLYVDGVITLGIGDIPDLSSLYDPLGSALAALLTAEAFTTSAISTAGTGYQPLNANLTDISGLAGAGYLTRTGLGAWVFSPSIAGATQIAVSNGTDLVGSPNLTWNGITLKNLVNDARVRAEAPGIASAGFELAVNGALRWTLLTPAGTGAVDLIDVAGNHALRANGAGLTGTGTAAPAFPWHVVGADARTISVVSGTTLGLRFGTDSGKVYAEAVDKTGVSAFHTVHVGGTDVELGILGAAKVWVSGQGNLWVGSTSDSGGGQGTLGLFNAPTAPVSNPVNSVVAYSALGAGKARGASGTITTWAPAEPRCPNCGFDFVNEFENDWFGRLVVCKWCFARWINSFAGQQPWIILTPPEK